jgi:phosphotransferase system enzyme I (PtsI)
MDDAAGEFRLHGIAAAPGMARATLVVIEEDETSVPCYPIDPGETHSELARLETAIQKTRDQLLSIQQQVSNTIGEEDAAVFEAHLLVLEDSTLLGAVNKQLQLKHLNVEHIYNHVASHYADALAGLDDPYLRERAADVRDICRRVLMNLAGRDTLGLPRIDSPCILVAHDLSPSQTAVLPRDKVLGFVTRVGSRTSHSAIMARALDIPAVVGMEEAGPRLQTGMVALLDGNHGLLIVNPSEETIVSYGAAESRHSAITLSLESLRDTRSVTQDDHPVILSANMELLAEIPSVLQSGAEGVGLFRSEFLFVGRDRFPNEEEQYHAYLEAARAMKPNPIILRTLDIGGDKLLEHFPEALESNPFLGVRAIRFCLAHPDIFRVQLRAMLRAAVEGNVRIMYPMISGVEEVLSANALLFEERDRLRSQGVPVPDTLDIGAMIETPSAALTAGRIAREVKFLSIGTNDLIQYSIAIDRGNERLAHLYQPTHPAILHLISRIIQSGHEAGVWVGVCGEMAGEFVMTPLLVGLGVDELSCGAALVPRVKRVIRGIRYDEVRTLTEGLFRLDSAEEIQSRLEDFARDRFPDLFE